VPGALPITSPAPGVPDPAPIGNVGWTQSLHDVRHTGTASVDGPTVAHVRWRRQLRGPLVPGPVVAPDGTIYAPTGAGQLHAIDPRTGDDRWVYDTGSGYGDDLTTGPGLLADGTIVWPGGGLKVYGVSPRGALLWTIQRHGTPLSPAVVSGDSFYLADSTGHLAAHRIGSTDPVLRWDLDLGDRSYGSPAVAPDGSIRATVDQQVVAVRDLGDRGEVIWQADTGDTVEVSAAVAADGTTLVGSNTSRLYALDESGHERWSIDLGSFPYSSPIADPRGRAWIGTNDGLLVSVDIASGRVLQRIDLSGTHDGRDGIWSSPVEHAAGRLYIGMLDGTVHSIASDGSLGLTVETGTQIFATGALTQDGAYIVGNEAGVLTAVG